MKIGFGFFLKKRNGPLMSKKILSTHYILSWKVAEKIPNWIGILRARTEIVKAEEYKRKNGARTVPKTGQLKNH